VDQKTEEERQAEEKQKEDAENEDESKGDWSISSSLIVPMHSGLIAVGASKQKEFCFVIKPSPGSRKLDLVPYS
jgi:hypothetical protein